MVEQSKGNIDPKKPGDSIDGFISNIKAELSHPLILRMMGVAFLGSEKKQVTKDGQTQEEDWTFRDILQAFQTMSEDEEKKCRQHLAKDLILGIDTQFKFFQQTEHPLRDNSADNLELICILLETVCSSREEIADQFPVNPKAEALRQAELLEVIRVTILKPASRLFMGIAGNGISSVPDYSDDDYLEKINALETPDMKTAKDKRDWNEYYRLDDERIELSLRTRNEQEWTGIIREENIYLTEYLHSGTAGAFIRTRNILDRLPNLPSDRISPQHRDEIIHFFEKRLKTLKKLQKELDLAKNPSEALQLFRTELNDPTVDFKALLEFISPSKKEN